MNLESKGFYEVPIQISTYPSYIIYSDNDGGELSVMKRLKLYFEWKMQDQLNKHTNSNDPIRKDIKEYWNENIKELNIAIEKYKNGNHDIEFYVI